jgi:hypothetical protein
VPEMRYNAVASVSCDCYWQLMKCVHDSPYGCDSSDCEWPLCQISDEPMTLEAVRELRSLDKASALRECPINHQGRWPYNAMFQAPDSYLHTKIEFCPSCGVKLSPDFRREHLFDASEGKTKNV